MVSYTAAADWSACADDLDRLRRAARDAADRANEVKAKADDFENCKRYPDMYDLMRDRCRSKAHDYQGVLRDFEGELGTLDKRVRASRSSCGFDLGGATGSYSVPQSYVYEDHDSCALFRSYKGKIPNKSLLETCTKTMSAAECVKCLK